MKFSHMMLLSTASAFTIAIDQGKLEEIAGNWQSSAEDFMRWSEEQDQQTLEAAQPYLDQMDAALQELVKLSDESSRAWVDELVNVATSTQRTMLEQLGCNPPENGEYGPITEEYQNCNWE